MAVKKQVPPTHLVPKLEENQEPLVRLVKDPLFWYQDYTPISLPWLGRQHFLRQGVLDLLFKVSRQLSLDHKRRYGLWIFETFVPAQTLVPFRFVFKEALKFAHPQMDPQELEKTWLALSPLPEHSSANAGAGIGLTLFDRKDRKTLWFGSKPTDLLKGVIPNQDGLSPQDQELFSSIKSNFLDKGFCHNPNKWWQFSYGDRLWAEQLQKPEYFYGSFAMPVPVLFKPKGPLPYKN